MQSVLAVLRFPANCIRMRSLGRAAWVLRYE